MSKSNMMDAIKDISSKKDMISRLFVLTALVWLLVGCVGKETYTIIISLDGFRWDYPALYGTPNLDRIACQGVSAKSMSPSFPASTFPNHYTLATGLVPDHHGIVNNTFWDTERDVRYAINDSATRNNPAYYGGEPIWITARKQGVKAGIIYWIGSDIPIKDTYPDNYKRWADTPRLDFAQRVDTAVAWLSKPERERPRLIMIYIDEPDGTGHSYGPKSEQTGRMVHGLDSLMGVLMDKIAQSSVAGRVNLIVTSDHGMAEVSADRIVHIDDYLKPAWYERVVGSNPSSVFTRDACRDSVLTALRDVEHISAYRKENIPAHLRYGTNKNIGDVVVIPDCGW